MTGKKVYSNGDKVEFTEEQVELIKAAQDRVASARYGVLQMSEAGRIATDELFKLANEINPALKDYEYSISAPGKGSYVVIRYKK